MYIETPKKTVHKNSEAVFAFLTELQNFQVLMPDTIEKFEVISPDRFLFALQGMPQIVLQRKEQTPFSQIVLGAASEKLPFTLTADITAVDSTTCEVVLSFEGKFNAMMAMMIKNPINNFIRTLSENLSKI